MFIYVKFYIIKTEETVKPETAIFFVPRSYSVCNKSHSININLNFLLSFGLLISVGVVSGY